MKQFFLLAFICCTISLTSAQNIQFPPSIVAAGGHGEAIGNKQVSKWRIGYVNILQLTSSSVNARITNLGTNNENESLDQWEVSAFPNPVEDILQIHFDTNKAATFAITATDLTGRLVLVEELQLIIPNQVVKLDLRNLISAIYIVHIRTSDNSRHAVLKVTKTDLR